MRTSRGGVSSYCFQRTKGTGSITLNSGNWCGYIVSQDLSICPADAAKTLAARQFGRRSVRHLALLIWRRQQINFSGPIVDTCKVLNELTIKSSLRFRTPSGAPVMSRQWCSEL